MMQSLFLSLKYLLFSLFFLGLIYTGAVTIIAELFCPEKANGSLLRKDGIVIGSELLAQEFQSEKYFWPRPSAAKYSTLPSGASNFGATDSSLFREIQKRRMTYADPLRYPGRPPADLLFASGSGLDPHISPEAAFFQVQRVANARKLPVGQIEALRKLVQDHIEGPQLLILGLPRVNVLQLNLALDRQWNLGP
jgi:potassium-transporting ATPase KdpC subunit